MRKGTRSLLAPLVAATHMGLALVSLWYRALVGWLPAAVVVKIHDVATSYRGSRTEEPFAQGVRWVERVDRVSYVVVLIEAILIWWLLWNCGTRKRAQAGARCP
jgi:hypothetical protein